MVRTARELLACDGRRVVLVGIYRKRLVPRKMNETTRHFFGHVDLELEGPASDVDPQAGSEPVRVEYGRQARPEAEVARFTDQRVQVTGRVVVRPAADPQVAQPKPRPLLVEFDDARAAG